MDISKVRAKPIKRQAVRVSTQAEYDALRFRWKAEDKIRDHEVQIQHLAKHIGDGAPAARSSETPEQVKRRRAKEEADRKAYNEANDREYARYGEESDKIYEEHEEIRKRLWREHEAALEPHWEKCKKAVEELEDERDAALTPIQMEYAGREFDALRNYTGSCYTDTPMPGGLIKISPVDDATEEKLRQKFLRTVEQLIEQEEAETAPIKESFQKRIDAAKAEYERIKAAAEAKYERRAEANRKECKRRRDAAYSAYTKRLDNWRGKDHA